MKYKISGTVIPQEKRKAINEKILYIIENNIQCGITASDIFSSYTGDGALHGLQYKDYNSRYEYGQAKKEREVGQFFTPATVCKFITDCIRPSKTDIVADLTCGMGNFFNFMPVEKNIFGCELDIKAYKVAKYLYPDANIQCEDIRHYNPEIKFDIVVGNPPYNLTWNLGRNEYLSQLYYCIKAFDLLKPAGLLALVMPNSFLADDFSDSGMIKEINNRFNFICQFDLPSDSFKNVGVENFATKIMFFQKKSEYLQDVEYSTDKINITDADTIYNRYIKPLQEQKEKIKSKLFFENLHNADSEEDEIFAYKVKKYLYDISVNPAINSNYGKCYEYVNKFYTQKMPEGMKWEEWEKTRLTHNKVLAYLRHYLHKQNEIEQDRIALVKTNYGLKLKGYNGKNKIYLSKYNGIKEMSFNDMIVNGYYPFEDKTYFQLYQRKLSAYNRQSQLYQDMQEDANIKSFLDNLVITDHENDEEIRLNPIQKSDTNKLIQKNYNFLQWEQGSGKSLSGIAQFLYRFQYNNIRNVFIVSTAIAINNTWEVILTNYKYNFIRINCMEDINNIQHGQIILITLNMLSKYQRQIKKYIKKHNKKVMLLLDESDSISSPTSKRTKAVLNCFRKVKYKSLATGTSTRNNISEAATQFELLYNNSINMLSECEWIYEIDRKSKEQEKPLIEVRNEYYMKPIPAYHEGYRLFSASHLPEKITVFGVGQKTQDIYNADILKNMIDKSIITRTQEEVTGRKLYEIIQASCSFNSAELDLYTTVIERFHEMKYLFTSTGNLRKDRMLEILNQLLLMLKVCVIPCAFKEYKSKEIPSKIIKLLKMLQKFNGERVAIGCRHIKTVMIYADAIRQVFPNRPLFIITGDSVSLNERKKIVKKLQNTTNGILISTQQSLSSSMNIGFVNKVIIPELGWNFAGISQYFFRFIRYSSTEWKQVYFITYENSIENNLLALLLAKEKLNLFMKNEGSIEEDELYEKYGVDFNILDMLMRKEKTKDGVKIRWGKQNIV
jgi:trans-aconitate methyltransferase